MSSEHEVAQQQDPSVQLSARDLLRRNRNDGGGTPDPKDWLTALIEGSDDAIVSRNLEGVIQSWNSGATRLFGYSAAEAIGESIAILIPNSPLEEDSAILARIESGTHTERLETRRRRKDGSLVDLSLTISVIRSENGDVVGASMIARDITERLMVMEQQRLIIGEMRHRVKNLFALATAIVSISARSSGRGTDVIDDIHARLSSLARAHDMTMADWSHHADNRQTSSLLMLIGRILDPYIAADGRVVIGGDDCDVGAKATPYLSLLLHELATNAAKFGSLSARNGRLDVSVAASRGLVRLVWRETGGPVPSTGGQAGFGSCLEPSVTRALATTIERDWHPTGLVATIAIPQAVLTA